MNRLTDRLRVRTVAFVAMGCVAALPALAADAADDRGQGSVHSDAGAVAGLAVGALAAGPVGAVVGAGVGALIGDRYHRQLQAKKSLAQDLNKSEAERTQLTASVAQLDGSLNQERARSAQLDATLQHADQIGVDVSFRTNDDAVTTQSMPPLLKLGGLIASMPQAQVRIAGYADPRGSDAWNDALSLRRAQSVAAVLTSAGVPRERILIEGHGKTESSSAEGDLDAYALDRRVTVRMELPGSGQVASRD
jgi:outer membrane protein OmpA-like peptidoglycan-associated protein